MPLLSCLTCSVEFQHELTSEKAVKSWLKKGPVGIGENHDNKAGRELVIRLIRADHVKRLFLELPKNAQEAIDRIYNDDDADVTTMYYMLLGSAGMEYGKNNEIKLAHLVDEAKKKEIPTYAAEVNGFDRKDFPARHEAINNCFLEKTQNGTSGSLLLWGSDHFTSREGSDVPLTNWITTLRYYIA